MGTLSGFFSGKGPDRLGVEERRVYRLHLLSTLAAAVVSGVTLNSEYIAANGLHASAWQVTLLVIVWPVSKFLSVVINSFVERRGCYRAAVIAAGFLRLPIALMSISKDVNLMLVLIACFSAADGVMVPVLNAILREKYAEGRRGFLFGTALSVFTFFSLPAAFLAGRLLDADFMVYRLLFVLMAAAGFIHAMIFAGMTRGMPVKTDTGTGTRLLRELWKVFSKDRQFALFESYFMIYGFAFMMILPAIPFFARDVLGLRYEQYAFAKGVLAQIGILFLSPLMGTRLEKLHPFRFTGIICLLLAVYPLLIATGGLFRSAGIPLFYAAFAVYSIAMAGINISWNMSSLHFAPPGQAATYQGLHVTLTSVRGLLAPLLGNAILLNCGLASTFLVSAGFFALAGLLFLRRGSSSGSGSEPLHRPSPEENLLEQDQRESYVPTAGGMHGSE
ncbi:MAG TPA: MFS transporter [Candidatus Fermentibacter daniensis]|nr:MFS transporter [Candidatus Fermentibacter daniensis]HQM41001.1 MFS transporter [Candidatus Fermentibacter daniensis]